MNNEISNTSARLGALRTAIYAFSIALLAALGTHNVIEQKTIDAIVPLIFPTFALGVAIWNVFPKKRPHQDIVLPTADEVADAVASRLGTGEDAPVARREDVPSVEDIVAAVVSGISAMPAPAARPTARGLRSDHGTEVQGVLGEVKEPSEPQL